MLEKILINHIEETLQAQMLQLIKCYENTINHVAEIAWRSACDLGTQQSVSTNSTTECSGRYPHVCVCVCAYLNETCLLPGCVMLQQQALPQ